MESFWIMRTFNPLFFTCFAFFIALLVIASRILKNRSEKAKKIVLITACVVTFIGFFVYKYFLSIDTEYDKLVVYTEPRHHAVCNRRRDQEEKGVKRFTKTGFSESSALFDCVLFRCSPRFSPQDERCCRRAECSRQGSIRR